MIGALLVQLILLSMSATPAATAEVAHPTRVSVGIRPYALLLTSYVLIRPSPTRTGPMETCFAYRTFYDSSDRDSLLSRAHSEFFDGAAPSTWSRTRRVAWAINAYNFLVIETVTRHLYQSPEGGGPPKPVSSVRDIQIGTTGLFDTPLVEIEGVSYTLDAFERRFVFDGYDPHGGGRPPDSLDPRAHFALVCAAAGCPPLRREPYNAGDLDRELDRATREALMTRGHLRWSDDGKHLEASSIFDWYAADFGGPKGVMAFIRMYAPEPVRKEIDRRGISRIDAFIPWDWRLNDWAAQGSD